MKKDAPGSGYYEGGYRYIIDGVPCRFPRKLSRNQLKKANMNRQFSTPYSKRVPMKFKQIKPNCECESCSTKALAKTLGMAAE